MNAFRHSEQIRITLQTLGRNEQNTDQDVQTRKRRHGDIRAKIEESVVHEPSDQVDTAKEGQNRQRRDDESVGEKIEDTVNEGATKAHRAGEAIGRLMSSNCRICLSKR